MAAKRRKYPVGFTLAEIMVATVIFVIAVLGTSAFRYHATLGAREADFKTTAARIAQLLCESWRGSSDPNAFGAAQSLDLTEFLGSGSERVLDTVDKDHGPYAAGEFTLLDHYEMKIGTGDGDNTVSYWATLSWRDVSPGLRALNVVVAWNPRSSGSDYSLNRTYRTFKLTTYVTY